MSSPCVVCDRDFKSDEALQQHKRDSPAHKFDCITCNRPFRNEQSLAQHNRDSPIHAQPPNHSPIPAVSPTQNPPAIQKPPPKPKPPPKRKPPTKPKPFKKWSMYPSLHNDLSSLLSPANLSFTFYEKDDANGCINDYDTTIMGRFTCSNTACLAVWTSKQIAITIRQYPKQRYNARVYFQSCKRCRMTSEPQLDHSYAERVAYRLKKWEGVVVQVPPFSGGSKGPHLSELCEGCRDGHCSGME
ncbi:hypothetical protein NX059_004661 [Plenodomus lindquistii]|nr:hypothetical protein NX059_004661 [Plenodomus lindquistii]